MNNKNEALLIDFSHRLSQNEIGGLGDLVDTIQMMIKRANGVLTVLSMQRDVDIEPKLIGQAILSVISELEDIYSAVNTIHKAFVVDKGIK